MNINENIWIEQLELKGDAMDEMREVHEAIADEQELTEADLDDWHASLIDEELSQEEQQIWNEFWNDKERDQL